MAMKVRRVVNGYNAAGKAVIKTDEQIAAVPRLGAGILGVMNSHQRIFAAASQFSTSRVTPDR
jgi:hypothetical protein